MAMARVNGSEVARWTKGTEVVPGCDEGSSTFRYLVGGPWAILRDRLLQRSGGTTESWWSGPSVQREGSSTAESAYLRPIPQPVAGCCWTGNHCNPTWVLRSGRCVGLKEVSAQLTRRHLELPWLHRFPDVAPEAGVFHLDHLPVETTSISATLNLSLLLIRYLGPDSGNLQGTFRMFRRLPQGHVPVQVPATHRITIGIRNQLESRSLHHLNPLSARIFAP